jgi:hypothetical protein
MNGKCFLNLILLTVVLLPLVSCEPAVPLLTLLDEPPEYILNAGRLSNLPESATNIHAEGWSGLFTGTSYLKFQADKTDIEQWINSSHSLSNATARDINDSHRYLLYGTADLRHEDSNYKTNYLTPLWYRPDIRQNGKLYEVPPDPRGVNSGNVIIDYNENTVYVRITWS